MSANVPIVVAIDGPAGSGKSSVAREVARRLGWQLLDTGSAYRAFTWWALRERLDLDDPQALAEALPRFIAEWQLSLDPAERWVRVGEHDVTDAIRTTEISEQVSKAAAVMPLREGINERFRELLFGADAPGIVAEGRDVTTVVAPDAPVRILLTADERVRIARRQAERTEDDAMAVAATVSERDAKDASVVDFLHAAEGVELVDSTHLDLEGTIREVMAVIERAHDPAAQKEDER